MLSFSVFCTVRSQNSCKLQICEVIVQVSLDIFIKPYIFWFYWTEVFKKGHARNKSAINTAPDYRVCMVKETTDGVVLQNQGCRGSGSAVSKQTSIIAERLMTVWPQCKCWPAVFKCLIVTFWHYILCSRRLCQGRLCFVCLQRVSRPNQKYSNKNCWFGELESLFYRFKRSPL